MEKNTDKDVKLNDINDNEKLYNPPGEKDLKQNREDVDKIEKNTEQVKMDDTSKNIGIDKKAKKNIEKLQKQLEEKNDELNLKDDELRKKSEEIDSLKELMQRRQADFENYKKRIMKTQDDQKKLAIKDLALEIININDDLLRAIDVSSDIDNAEALKNAHIACLDGVQIISKQIEDSLKKFGIVEVDSMDKEFDPNFNEAVEFNISEAVSFDTITKIYQKGFHLNGLVIRSAKVCVTKPGKEEKKEVQGNDNEEVDGTRSQDDDAESEVNDNHEAH